MPSPRGLQDLVEHQIRRWKVERRSAIPAPRAPCIALSRLPHSGAAELGRQIAEWLDYGFFGIEIVDSIARAQSVQRELVVGLDERVRNAIDRNVLDFFRAREFTEDDYLRHVVHTITTLGERGQAVILGRGAPFVLPAEHALRVFVVAPTETRLERLRTSRDLEADEAARQLAREDEERRHFLSRQFHAAPDDPAAYDLVINTGSLSTQAAGRVVIEALRRRFPTDS